MNSGNLNNKTFRALMAYLNPVGPIGANIDMWGNEVEYYPSNWTSEDTMRFKMLDLFQDFIRNIISVYGDRLYNNTNKQDSVYWVDVTINPRKREIKLVPKYYTYSEEKDNRSFDWRELRHYYPLSKFMEDMEVDKLIIDYNGFENNFDATITYEGENMKKEDVRYFSDEIRNMIGEIFESDGWNDEGGGYGVMKLYDEDSNGYLHHNHIYKHITSGDSIILKEEDFK
jgi:uncharacterized protein YrzB (UPF0473 family)